MSSVILDFFHNNGGGVIYGVQFADDGTAVRTYDSKGLNFTPSSTTVIGQDDFIKIKSSPFHIKECLSQYNSETGKQEVVAYEGDTDYSTMRSNSNYNVMIEFPKFYYSRPTKYEWMISSYPIQGFAPSPMHYRNGVMHDYAYMAKYMSNSSYMSRPGQIIAENPSHNHHDGTGYTIANFRSGFRNIGMYCADYATYCSINILMLVKYATLNIQNLIGYGWSGKTAKAANTGGADGVLGKDGYAASNKMDNGQIVAMGIEDYYGNCWKFVDGIFKNPEKVFINTDIENITENPSSSSRPGYLEVPSGTVNAMGRSTFGWITDFTYDIQFPWTFFPETVQEVSNQTWPSGDPGLKISDGYWVNPANGDCVAFVGGPWDSGFANGPFYLGMDSPLGFADLGFSASAFFLS